MQSSSTTSFIDKMPRLTGVGGSRNRKRPYGGKSGTAASSPDILTATKADVDLIQKPFDIKSCSCLDQLV